MSRYLEDTRSALQADWRLVSIADGGGHGNSVVKRITASEGPVRVVAELRTSWRLIVSRREYRRFTFLETCR